MQAVYLGVDLDKVGQNNSLVPDGQPDHHFQVSGFNPALLVIKRRITQTNGAYVAETPYNNANWNFLVVPSTPPGIEDWWSSVSSAEGASPAWHVQVFYADGTMAECDVTAKPDFQFTVPSGKTYRVNAGPIILVP